MSDAVVHDEAGLERALRAAEDAAPVLAATAPGHRASVLEVIAEAIDGHRAELIDVAGRETHLPAARLAGELTRTVFQLRLFAGELREGRHLDATVDHADAEWPMGPRPDLRRTRIPLGPVLVFAASNFPYAFGVVGGDTASAWAAGCPVLAKAHSYQPGTADVFATAVREGLRAADLPGGVFTVVHGRELGTAALLDPRIRAAGFTGSLEAGRMLFDLAAGRPDPIPFYGELSSLNPVFVTPAADAARGDAIGREFAASYTLGAGQFCTKPGLLFVPDGSSIPARVIDALADVPAARLLHPALAAQFAERVAAVASTPGAATTAGTVGAVDESPAPVLLELSADDVRARPEGVLTECFGPAAVIVRYGDITELPRLAALFPGQLTAGVQGEAEDADLPVIRQLVTTLAERSGRLLWNGWPTGVTVSWAQQHGGPYPATTAPGTTSVGTAAIARFSRPVAYQGFPARLLPDELRDEPVEPVRRLVDGAPVEIRRD